MSFSEFFGSRENPEAAHEQIRANFSAANEYLESTRAQRGSDGEARDREFYTNLLEQAQ